MPLDLAASVGFAIFLPPIVRYFLSDRLKEVSATVFQARSKSVNGHLLKRAHVSYPVERVNQLIKGLLARAEGFEPVAVLLLIPAEVTRDRDSTVTVVVAVAGLKIETGLPLPEEQAQIWAKFLHDVRLRTAAPQLSAGSK